MSIVRIQPIQDLFISLTAVFRNILRSGSLPGEARNEALKFGTIQNFPERLVSLCGEVNECGGREQTRIAGSSELI